MNLSPFFFSFNSWTKSSIHSFLIFVSTFLYFFSCIYHTSIICISSSCPFYVSVSHSLRFLFTPLFIYQPSFFIHFPLLSFTFPFLTLLHLSSLHFSYFFSSFYVSFSDTSLSIMLPFFIFLHLLLYVSLFHPSSSIKLSFFIFLQRLFLPFLFFFIYQASIFTILHHLHIPFKRNPNSRPKHTATRIVHALMGTLAHNPDLHSYLERPPLRGCVSVYTDGRWVS